MINLVTKKPLEESYYSIQQQVGSYDFTAPPWMRPANSMNQGRRRTASICPMKNTGSFREFIDNQKLFIAPAVYGIEQPHADHLRRGIQ